MTTSPLERITDGLEDSGFQPVHPLWRLIGGSLEDCVSFSVSSVVCPRLTVPRKVYSHVDLLPSRDTRTSRKKEAYGQSTFDAWATVGSRTASTFHFREEVVVKAHTVQRTESQSYAADTCHNATFKQQPIVPGADR